eukprot:scaffold1245_cov252-Pinguiococcus_pyrenoidosus.AAC.19
MPKIDVEELAVATQHDVVVVAISDTQHPRRHAVACTGHREVVLRPTKMSATHQVSRYVSSAFFLPVSAQERCQEVPDKGGAVEQRVYHLLGTRPRHCFGNGGQVCALRTRPRESLVLGLPSCAAGSERQGHGSLEALGAAHVQVLRIQGVAAGAPPPAHALPPGSRYDRRASRVLPVQPVDEGVRAGHHFADHLGRGEQALLVADGLLAHDVGDGVRVLDDLEHALHVARADAPVRTDAEVEALGLPEAVHDAEHLQHQLVLAQVVARLEHDLVRRRVSLLLREGEPQRLLRAVHEAALGNDHARALDVGRQRQLKRLGEHHRLQRVTEHVRALLGSRGFDLPGDVLQLLDDVLLMAQRDAMAATVAQVLLEQDAAALLVVRDVLLAAQQPEELVPADGGVDEGAAQQEATERRVVVRLEL